LDSAGGQEVIELLSRLHAGGQTIILVTHDQDVAAAADTVLRMRDGRILGADTDMVKTMVETVTVIGTL
jgi:ABC-type lipoprotein export system ATPase subunit